MPAPTRFSLHPSDNETLLLDIRHGTLEELQEDVTAMTAHYLRTAQDILAAVRDEDSAPSPQPSSPSPLPNEPSSTPPTTHATGNTALHYAAANNRLSILRWILQQTTLPFTQQESWSTLRARGWHSQETTANMLRRTNYAGNTPLHYAAVNGHVDVARLLVESMKAVPPGSPVDFVVEEEGEAVGVRAWWDEKATARARSAYVRMENDAGQDAVFEAERREFALLAGVLLGYVVEGEGEGSGEREEKVGQERGEEENGDGRLAEGVHGETLNENGTENGNGEATVHEGAERTAG